MTIIWTIAGILGVAVAGMAIFLVVMVAAVNNMTDEEGQE